ncbi:hypothetical protein CEXT_129881 [Caerostris extrusa]|uniref:Uncharacterized protein n=1 Tax=Caerostris extrusa TaxID=172846 RepID=A0AAV4P2J7_CAEEX|nr:hypothetical protein CEXT_129881 [Caerostris extrusa]
MSLREDLFLLMTSLRSLSFLVLLEDDQETLRKFLPENHVWRDTFGKIARVVYGEGKEQLEQQEVGGGNVAPSFSLSPSFCHQKLIPVGSRDSFVRKAREWRWVQEMKVRAVTVSDEGDVSDYLLSCFGKMNEIGLRRHATKDNASCVFPPRR